MKQIERTKLISDKEFQWDLIDRCLLPLIFSHAAAVIFTFILNLFKISNISYFSVFIIIVFFTILILLSYHNLKVSYAGKCVILSGCENLIGYNIAKYLDDLGLTVYAGVYNNDEQKRKLKAECSGRLCVIDLDVTSIDSINNMKLFIEQNSTLVWAIINVANYPAFGETEWIPISLLKKTIDINLLGTIQFIQTFLPHLRKTKGRVVNVTSVAAHIRSGIRSPLCISANSLHAFTDCLRQDMNKYGIDVILVESGLNISSTFYEKDKMLEQARNLWLNFTEEQRKIYNEKYFEFQISSMVEYSNQQENLNIFLRAIRDAVTRTFPLAKYTPVTKKEKLQAFIAQYFPTSVYNIIYE